MLIQVGIFLPLLVGLLLLYPWLAGSRKIKYSQEDEETKGEQERTMRLASSSNSDLFINPHKPSH